MKYLKDKQYYIDLCDKLTIEGCRRIEQDAKDKKPTSDKEAVIKKEWAKVCIKVMLYCYTGEEYLKKEKTINEWMDRAARKDDFLEQTELSMDVCCQNCKMPMVFELKTLHCHDDEHVLFFFRCDKCRKDRAFLETGEEYIPEKSRCPKCGTEFNEKTIKEGKKLTITRHCDKCGLNDDFVYDNDAKEKLDPNYTKDRARFCLTKEEGQKYAEGKWGLESVSHIFEDQKKREAEKPAYDQLKTMQKLTVVQLKQLLQPKLAKAGYISLVFAEPKIERNVIIDFTAEDSKDDRTKYESIQDLKKLVKATLYNVNWNLMTDDPNYRMGVLSGRLKGLETEEDLLQKIRKRKPSHCLSRTSRQRC